MVVVRSDREVLAGLSEVEAAAGHDHCESAGHHLQGDPNRVRDRRYQSPSRPRSQRASAVNPTRALRRLRIGAFP